MPSLTLTRQRQKNIMKNILVPIDFSEYSEFALKSAIPLARKMNAKLTLFHVLKPNETEAETRHALDSAEKELLHDVVFDYQTSVGKPVDEIVNASADLIIMGSHGASGLTSFFVGTNSERVAKHANCPVIVLKEETDLLNIKSIVYPTDMRSEQAEVAKEVK